MSSFAISLSSLAVVYSILCLVSFAFTMWFRNIYGRFQNLCYSISFKINLSWKCEKIKLDSWFILTTILTRLSGFIRYWIMLLSASGRFHLQMSRHEHYSIFFGSASSVRPLYIFDLCSKFCYALGHSLITIVVTVSFNTGSVLCTMCGFPILKPKISGVNSF